MTREASPTCDCWVESQPDGSEMRFVCGLHAREAVMQMRMTEPALDDWIQGNGQPPNEGGRRVLGVYAMYVHFAEKGGGKIVIDASTAAEMD